MTWTPQGNRRLRLALRLVWLRKSRRRRDVLGKEGQIGLGDAVEPDVEPLEDRASVLAVRGQLFAGQSGAARLVLDVVERIEVVEAFPSELRLDLDGLAKLADDVRIAVGERRPWRTRLVPALGVGDQHGLDQGKALTQLVGVLGQVELEDRQLVSGVDLEVAVPRRLLAGDEDLEAGAVEADVLAGLELLHVLAVDGIGELRRPLDQVHEGAHGDVHPLAGEHRLDAVQRHQVGVLHRHDPRDERAVVERAVARHGWHERRGGLAAGLADDALALDDPPANGTHAAPTSTRRRFPG